MTYLPHLTLTGGSYQIISDTRDFSRPHRDTSHGIPRHGRAVIRGNAAEPQVEMFERQNLGSD
jgi:hypothetical protein